MEDTQNYIITASKTAIDTMKKSNPGLWEKLFWYADRVELHGDGKNTVLKSRNSGQ